MGHVVRWLNTWRCHQDRARRRSSSRASVFIRSSRRSRSSRTLRAQGSTFTPLWARASALLRFRLLLGAVSVTGVVVVSGIVRIPCG